MYVLGISGGFDSVYESDQDYRFYYTGFHDSAAVLIKDNEVIAAIEEERISRNKHTNKFPHNAIKFVLKQSNIDFEDLDYIAYNMSDKFLEQFFKRYHIYENRGHEYNTTPVKKFTELFKQNFGVKIPAEKFKFVEHHISHAASTYYLSGFEKSLIMTIDGNGEEISTMFFQGDKNQIKKLSSTNAQNSLGYFYTHICGFLGYGHFEEYKVMGLAPYGDPNRFIKLFKTFYKLKDNGLYELDFEKTHKLYDYLIPRESNQPLLQIHKDIAAGLQLITEDIVLHMCKYFQNKTKSKNLCIAGGVGQNSKMNGMLLKSKLFENIFVQPASHDSGCSIGAALKIAYDHKKLKCNPQLKQVYWGTDINKTNISGILKKWSSFIDFRSTNNEEIASLLSKGLVFGWVQDKSEFGPRALGNRSIIADPRPVENKDRINSMVKKREGFRPFAPSILMESLEDFFVVSNNSINQNFSFMSFVVDVKPEWQKKLGAITHVDGTARIQTVNKETNFKYWDLIKSFGKITGVPILLNTSFNNNAEPIVDNLLDSITCYLTSDLDYLVVDNLLIEKNKNFIDKIGSLAISLPYSARLRSEKKYTSFNTLDEIYYLSWNYFKKKRNIDQKIYDLLNFTINKNLSLDDAMKFISFSSADYKNLNQELFNLWSERLIILSPK